MRGRTAETFDHRAFEIDRSFAELARFLDPVDADVGVTPPRQRVVERPVNVPVRCLELFVSASELGPPAAGAAHEDHSFVRETVDRLRTLDVHPAIGRKLEQCVELLAWKLVLTPGQNR